MPKRKSDIADDDHRRAKLKKHEIHRQYRDNLSTGKFKETEYYFENGLRKVYPYDHVYTTYCKGRWTGRPLLAVFADEFRAHPIQVYEECVTSGRLTVNGDKVPTDYVLKDNDLVANRVHRHETPVMASPIKIIHKSDDILVVDKPPSIPVHPCGRYRNNTLSFILAKEHGFEKLHVLHRLDRLTSGVLMFGLNLRKTQSIEEQIRERKVSKEYLCRVDGKFTDGEITCIKPISNLSHKIGVCYVDETGGKSCQTLFKRLSFNGKSSVVSCKPTTGRMHQIRVHLQYLGFPIVNDPIYNHSLFGPEKGKHGNFGKEKEELVSELMKLHTTENWLGLEDQVDTLFRNPNFTNEMALKSLGHYTSGEEFERLSKQYVLDDSKLTNDETCHDCKIKFNEPKPRDLVMFLHAWKYKGEGFDFETDVPVWAKEEYDDC